MKKEIEDRRSIRKYKNIDVDHKTILELLDSARLAPSGNNSQPWQFIIVRESNLRNEIAEASHDQKWMNTAPVYIVCVADMASRENDFVKVDENSPELSLKKIIRDTSIAIEHIVLEAVEKDLGTCWIAWFSQADIRPVLNIPDNKYVVAILTVGYPDENPEPRKRKKLEDIVHYEKW